MSEDKYVVAAPYIRHPKTAEGLKAVLKDGQAEIEWQYTLQGNELPDFIMGYSGEWLIAAGSLVKAEPPKKKGATS